MQQGYIPQPFSPNRNRRSDNHRIPENPKRIKQRRLLYLLFGILLFISICLSLYFVFILPKSDDRYTLDGFIESANEVADKWGYERFNGIDGTLLSSENGKDMYSAYPSFHVSILYICDTKTEVISDISIMFDKYAYDAYDAMRYCTCFMIVWDNEFNKDEALEVASILMLKTIGSFTYGIDSYYAKTIRHNIYASFAFEEGDQYVFTIGNES